MRYAAVEKLSAHHAVSVLCRMLGVQRSGYYAWRRGPSPRARQDRQLTELIRTVFVESRCTYGAPRVRAELAFAHGQRVGRKRVARLMRTAGLVGCHRRRRGGLTRRDPKAGPIPDLVARRFTAAEPDATWTADITQIPTGQGWLYLAVVLDVFSRRIVGWAMAEHMRTELVIDALAMAIRQRQPKVGVIHHSDQGSQYTSISFGQHARAAGVQPSVGAVGSCFDNAVTESFFATLECELIDRTRFTTRDQARSAVFDFIEGWYNHHRRHSYLGYLSPAEYERHHTNQPRYAAA